MTAGDSGQKPPSARGGPEGSPGSDARPHSAGEEATARLTDAVAAADSDPDATGPAAHAAEAASSGAGAGAGAGAGTGAGTGAGAGAGADDAASAAASRPRMPRWLPRAMVLALALIAAFQLAHWAFIQLIGLLVQILVSFVLALAIEPAVDWLGRHHMRRGIAAGIVFIVMVLILAGLVTALGTLLVEETSQLANQLPHYAESLINWFNRTFHRHVRLSDLQKGLLTDSGAIKDYVTQIANNAWGISSTVIGGLFKLFTIAMFTFYFAADGPRLRRTVCSALPPSKQETVLRAWEIAVAKTGGYLYSRLLQAAISALAHFLMLWLLGVPYAALLAIFAGMVSQFIPTIGTYIGGALPVLLALTVSPMTAVWVLVFEVAYQQVENYLIHPRITAVTVDIHPAVAFGSVLVGAALLGAVGALIAIPVTATLQTFVGTYIRRYEVADPRVEDMTRRKRRGASWMRRPRHGPHDPGGSGGSGGESPGGKGGDGGN